MPREIYLYEPLNSYLAKDLVAQLEELKKEKTLKFRINGPGGSVYAGWGFLSKLSEYKGRKEAIVDGQAASMYAFLLLFMDNVIVNESSSIMFHRAAYPEYFTPTEAQKTELSRMNALFKDKMLKKGLPSELVSKIFDGEVREDVFITSQEAVRYGLAQESRLIPVAEINEIRALAENNFFSQSLQPECNQTKKVMNITELKQSHPELFAQVLEQGIEQERKRINNFLPFIKATENSCASRSLKAVKEGETFNDVQGEIQALFFAEAQITAQATESPAAVQSQEVSPQGDQALITSTEVQAQEKTLNAEREEFEEVMKKRGYNFKD